MTQKSHHIAIMNGILLVNLGIFSQFSVFGCKHIIQVSWKVSENTLNDMPDLWRSFVISCLKYTIYVSTKILMKP